MLRFLALSFLVVMVAVVAVLAALVALALTKVARSNRVDPRTPTPAPLTWTISPSRGARLHRRLQSAAAPLALFVPRQPDALPMGTTDLARRAIAEAVETDRAVFVAAGLPRRARREELRVLDRHVAELEQVSRRIVATQRTITAGAVGGPNGTRPEVVAEITERLDLLDAAQAELTRIEQQGGLVDPEALLRGAPAPELRASPTVAPTASTRPAVPHPPRPVPHVLPATPGVESPQAPVTHD